MYEAEALSWLAQNKNDPALAGNRFRSNKDAIEAVRRLYAAGAVRVDVIVSEHDAEYIKKYGGEYTDRLQVYGTPERRDTLRKVVEELAPDGLGTEWDLEDWDGKEILLWWD